MFKTKIMVSYSVILPYNIDDFRHFHEGSESSLGEVPLTRWRYCTENLIVRPDVPTSMYSDDQVPVRKKRKFTK